MMTLKYFIAGFLFGVFISFPILELFTTNEPTPSTTPIECIDGKLYDVSYQGKIKILDRSALMYCEVIK